MIKYSFENDYSEGAHPRILEALAESNLKQRTGYGLDEECAEASEKIREIFGCPGAQVHFLVGGTQTNMTAIAAALRPHQAVIAAETGHINVHETGAIEATGHKVLTVRTEDGKLCPADIETVAALHSDEHMVQPRLVYISDSTEVGTIYHKKELKALSDACRRLGLLLFLDGARLGAAFACAENDLRPEDLPELCDMFYIGGTKNGALFGEALVLVNPALFEDFRWMIKQKGGMLAKGWLLGLQFKLLFTDGLYWELAAHAEKQAAEIRDGLKELGVEFRWDSPTNQLFPIFNEEQVEKLSENFRMTEMDCLDGNRRVVRLVTSWSTKPEAAEEFLRAVRNVTGY